LGRLIHNAPQLVLPYVPPIEKALVTKLRAVPPAAQTISAAGGGKMKNSAGAGVGRRTYVAKKMSLFCTGTGS